MGTEPSKQPKSVYSLRLRTRGRIVFPAEVRARLGLRDGEPLVLTVEPDGTMLVAKAKPSR